MKLFKPKYYFTLTKYRKNVPDIVFVLYLKNGKFHCSNNIYSQYLLTWPAAMKYNFLFWWHSLRGTSEKLFGYKTFVSGFIHLKKLPNDFAAA